MSVPAEIQRWLGESLFEAVPVSIAVIDRRFDVVLVNRSFEQLFGPWQGRPCWAVFKDRTRKCGACPADAAFADGQMQLREEVGRSVSGETAHYLVQVMPVHQPDGEVPYCIEMATDITGLRRLEQEIIEAERLAAMGQTVAGLAHGIKNIITGLEGGLYVMRIGIQKGRADRLQSGWEMLERNVGRISQLSKGLLEFSRGGAPDIRPVDPMALAAEVVALYRDAAARDEVAVTLEAGAPVPVASLDPSEIHDCLTNLVSNGVDACKMSERGAGHVVVRVADREGALVFEVEDDGVGMDAEVKRKLFTTFFTTKTGARTDKGTGIGLLQVRKIANAHGGRVSATSEAGQGSLFRLVLPWDRLPRAAPVGLPDHREERTDPGEPLEPSGGG